MCMGWHSSDDASVPSVGLRKESSYLSVMLLLAADLPSGLCFLSRSGGEKGLRGSGAGTLGVPLGGPRRVGGLLGVAGRLSGTVSPFRAEQGTSLETPSRARAPSCEDVGTTWFFSSCGGILELRRGFSCFLFCRPWEAQSSIRVARESWGLCSSHCRAKETSSRLVSRT